jgi:hypothetical protein
MGQKSWRPALPFSLNSTFQRRIVSPPPVMSLNQNGRKESDPSVVCEVVVSPQITSIDPAQGVVGLTYPLTITGTGFTSAAVVNVDQTGSGTTGITVQNIQAAPPSQILCDFQIAQNASPGNHKVTVSVAGQTSNSMNFFVQVPTRVTINNPGSLVTIDPGPGNIVDLSGQTINTVPVCGAYQNFTYQLADQNGNAIQEQGTVDETVTVVSGPANLDTHTSSAAANEAGQFGDTQGMSEPYPSCPPKGTSITANQTLTATLTLANGPSQRFPLTTVHQIVSTKAAGSSIQYSFTVTTTTQ